MFKTARYNLLNWRLLIQRTALAVVFLALLFYAVWPWLPGVQGVVPRTIIVYGFSILGEVMNDGIFPAFKAEWQAQTGETVEFVSSFAGSGTITNQLIMGVPAEVAILSLELDAIRLADEGVLTGHTWRNLPNQGVLNRTPFIILVRRDNPKRIHDFRDLTQDDVEIIHPDPLTSGGAMWGILAEYGSALRLTGDEGDAFDQLAGVWRNVVAQAASARAARTQFNSGFGDALITYEQEVVVDLMRDQLNGEIVYPESTILSEHIVVTVDKNIPSTDRQLVEAFVAFLWSTAAQQIFVQHGFRSVDEALNTANPYFGVIQDPFTVRDMGGWVQAKQDIVDDLWRNRVLLEIDQ